MNQNKAFLWPLFCATIFATSCNNKPAIPEAETFQVVRPLIKDIEYNNEYVTDIQSVNHAEVRSRIKGYIEKVHVDEGQKVVAGQLLFTLSSPEYQQEVQKARAAHKNAVADLKAVKVELLNMKSLMEKEIISKAEYDVMKARVEALEADVEEADAHRQQAEQNLKYANITAPYEGTINRIPKKMGSLIDEGEMLTSISDDREMFAYFNLSETDYLDYVSHLSPNDSKKVSLILANNEPYPVKGNVEIIASEFDRSTGNIAFRARFANPDKILKHGSNGKIVVSKKVRNAMVIPQKSSYEIQDLTYVFVVDRDSTVRQRNVTLALRIPHYFILEGGLNEGETIVYEGVQRLRDQMKVTPEPISLEEVIRLAEKH